jgi:hypothetical protein
LLCRRILHGKQVREEGIGKSRREHARDEAREVEERRLRQEGDEPQAGHRHRTFGSAPRRRKGAVEEIVVEEVFVVIVEEVFIVLVEEVLILEEEHFEENRRLEEVLVHEEIGEEEVARRAG